VRELDVAGSRVVIRDGALNDLWAFFATDRLREHRAAIVTDSNVGPLYAARVAAALETLVPVVITIPAGEIHKTRETWSRVTDEMLANHIGRDGVVVALGGGVVGDLAGFVAATYLRGIPVVQIPTSLIAMIDASIGGKTGVDVSAGKNLVGAFHPPTVIVVDPSLLATLPERELRGGLAEAIKHGVIADAAYFERVAREGRRPSFDLVARSIEIKAEIVNADPREAGRRKVLNFGHTLGHAIESASEYTMSHGEAIAVGMSLEARLGESIGVTKRGTADAVDSAIRAAGLPLSHTFDPADLLRRTRGDKKVRAGNVEYALPSEIGGFGSWTTPVDDAAVLSVLGRSP
jgi:3-dehydroquinate synthase